MKAAESKCTYWANAESTQSSLNNFSGTFAITDHLLIPNPLMDYLSEKFYKVTRLKRVSLADINDALNDVWEGPGSMVKITQLTCEMKHDRQINGVDTPDPLKGYATPTIDTAPTDTITVDKSRK